MPLKHRLFRDKDDYIKLRSFLEESISASGSSFYYGLGDFDFGVAINSSPDYLGNINEIFKNACLWFDEHEQLNGGIWPNGNIVDMFIHPHKKKFFNEMVEVAEEFVKSNISEGSGNNEIEWWLFEGDTELEDILKKRGYYKTELYRTHRVFDYSVGIDEPKLPEGFKIKSLSEVDDKSTIIELYKIYFKINLKERAFENFTRTPTYRRELDLVITTPDEKIACFCTVRYDQKNRIGTFEPVACHPEYKRMGLTKAIMQEALKRAMESGANTITVQTSDPKRNLPANKLYESVGFRKIGDLYFWRKKIL